MKKYCPSLIGYLRAFINAFSVLHNCEHRTYKKGLMKKTNFMPSCFSCCKIKSAPVVFLVVIHKRTSSPSRF